MIALVCGFLFLSALVSLVALFWVSFKVWEMRGTHISQIFSRSLVSRQNNAVYCIGLADLDKTSASERATPCL